ncbi:MAG: hypothetical protein U0271_37135 [Polyangiaceae bacterium]
MKLEEVVRAALEPYSPHLVAVGRFGIEKGEHPYRSTAGAALFVGANRERVQDEGGEVRRSFQEVIHRAPGLRVVIIHASRTSEREPWRITHKLLAGVEVDALRKQRSKIDASVKAELKKLQAEAKGDYYFFGSLSGSSKVQVFDDAGAHPRPASPELLRQFADAVRIYQAAGLELTDMIWKLRGRAARGGGSSGWQVDESFV